jgi:CubicO group peptidase (beta-lactamase class C family)
VHAAVFAILAALAFAPEAGAAELNWPSGGLSAHVQAYFAQLRGSEAEARAFFDQHMSPAALADANVDARLQRRATMLSRVQGLTPLEVVVSEPAHMQVRCRAGNGEELLAIFEGEPDMPHKLLGVRLEAVGEPGEGPPRLAGPALTPGEAASQVRESLDRHARDGRFSGVALLAQGDTTLLLQSWGLADREKQTPITPATRFNLASIGKLFTRAAIAQLAAQGKLSLDDKLSKYMPQFPHADEITIEMLAEHRSGVGDIFNAQYNAMDHSKLRHNRDYLALIRDQPLWFPPGTSRRYSNGGYVLLGEVIAKASGEDYYDYLARHLFAPAGMKNTLAPIEGDGTPGLARGYTRKGTPAGSEVDNAKSRPARGSAAGGIYSTASDLLAFDRALLGGRLCPKPWAEWATDGPRPGPGAASATAGPPLFGFAGGAPGISTEWMRQGETVLIVLTNRDPEVNRPILQELRDVVRRVRPGAKRSS